MKQAARRLRVLTLARAWGVIYGGVMVSDGGVMVVYGDSSVGGHGLLGKWGAEDDLEMRV